MKKINSTELGLLVVASMFLVAGMIWWAQPADVGSVQYVRYGNGESRRLKQVSTVLSSKVYGAVAIALGAGIYLLVLYRPKDRISSKLHTEDDPPQHLHQDSLHSKRKTARSHNTDGRQK